MKKLTVFLLCAALLAAALTGCGSKKEDEAPADGSGTEASADSISTEAPADTDAEKPADFIMQRLRSKTMGPSPWSWTQMPLPFLSRILLIWQRTAFMTALRSIGSSADL